MYNVTFIFTYGSLTVTVESEATDHAYIAMAANEIFYGEYGFSPLHFCSDYGVETLDTAAGI